MIVKEAIEKRWSPRAFSDKSIEEHIVESLLEAARWAPSSMNEQPWRFTIGKKNQGENWDKLFNSLMDGNKPWAEKAPLLIGVFAKTNFDYKNRPNKHAWYDTGQAVAQMTLQATELGVHFHQMGGFFADKLKENFQLSEDIQPVAVIAVGYLGEADELPEELKKREEAPRKRKELSEILI